MSFRTATTSMMRPLRAAATANTRLAATPISMAARRSFHASRPAFIKVGDPLPNIDVLMEGNPGNKVSLGEESGYKNLIVVGVPAAFSPACSSSHVPSYIQHPKAKEYDSVAVVSVNDVFV